MQIMKFYHVKLTQTQDKCHFGAISKKPSQKPARLKKNRQHHRHFPHKTLGFGIKFVFLQ